MAGGKNLSGIEGGKQSYILGFFDSLSSELVMDDFVL
jgi:hypothetical protein